MSDAKPENSDWYQGVDGKWYPPVRTPGQVPSAPRPAAARRKSRGDRVFQPKTDLIGEAIEAFGVVLVCLSVLTGIIYAALAIAEGDGYMVAIGVAVALGGSLPGLLVAGFGRIVQHTKRSADLQFQSAVLLAEGLPDPE